MYITAKESVNQIVIDLHNIARRAESMGNPDGIGYSIRRTADRLSELNKQSQEVKE
jgi:hypothetical protein